MVRLFGIIAQIKKKYIDKVKNKWYNKDNNKTKNKQIKMEKIYLLQVSFVVMFRFKNKKSKDHFRTRWFFDYVKKINFF